MKNRILILTIYFIIIVPLIFSCSNKEKLTIVDNIVLGQTKDEYQTTLKALKIPNRDFYSEWFLLHPEDIVKQKINMWSVPKGHVDGEESYPDCASRELREESGLEISPRELERCKRIRISDAIIYMKEIEEETYLETLKSLQYQLTLAETALEKDYQACCEPEKATLILSVKHKVRDLADEVDFHLMRWWAKK